jgi:hypothetical protein
VAVKLVEFLIIIIGRIDFSSFKYLFTGRSYNLLDKDIETAVLLLCSGRFCGLSRRNTHLSTLAVNISHFILTGKWRYWSHAWINADDYETPLKLEISESISKGVIKSRFWNVFNCDGLVLLKPKYLSDDEWEKVNKYIDETFLGKGYDFLANLKKNDKVNCVELLFRVITKVNPCALPNTSRMIKKYKNLTPDMIYESGDFEIVYEVRR